MVVLLTLLLLGLGVYGLINLQKEFRPEWLVDPQAEGKKVPFAAFYG